MGGDKHGLARADGAEQGVERLAAAGDAELDAGGLVLGGAVGLKKVWGEHGEVTLRLGGSPRGYPAKPRNTNAA